MKRTLCAAAIAVAAILMLPGAAFAHTAGPLDSGGGHTDKSNVSGYGDYHYHCGSFPAHPHPRGVCPYDPSQGPIIDSPPECEAAPTASTVLVNGKNISFDAYKIYDSNYFKLRDLAFTLNGTPKQFAVNWDEAKNAISLTSGKPYTPAGGEMSGGWASSIVSGIANRGGGVKTAIPSSSTVYVDGKATLFDAYTINDSNYFKLRDIGAAFNFGVDWDEYRNTISIDTGKPYKAPADSSNAAGNSDRTNAGRDYHGELVGYLWHASNMLGSGWAERFLMSPDNSFIYAASQMDGESRLRFIKGAWEIKDGYLILTYKQAVVWEGGKAVPAMGSTGTKTEIVNAKTVVKPYMPPEQHKFLIGNYLYNDDEPHPWSVCFESPGLLLDGWWYRYDSDYDAETLIDDLSMYD